MARPRAKKVEEYEIPASYIEEYGEPDEGFKKAFNHAKSMDNSDKAALQYALAHGGDDEYTDGATA